MSTPLHASSSSSPLTPVPGEPLAWRIWFQDSDDAQFVCSRSGSVLHINDRAVRQFGVQPQSSLLQSGLFAPATVEQLLEIFTSNDQHGWKTLGNVGVSCPGGACLIADLKLALLDPERWIITVQDAGRLRRLEAHTQRLLAAIDSTPDVVILTDASFKMTFVNPAFEHATGYTIEEALGRQVDSLQAPGETRKTREYLDGVSRGADWVGELSMVRRDGSVYPVEMTFSPVHDSDGTFIGAVAFQRDISSRKKIHDAFLAERNFVQSIINSLDACLYTLDGRLRITHFNNGWQKMPAEHGALKITEPPKVGALLLDYVPDPTRRLELEKAFHVVLAEGQPQELQSVDPNGRHWVMNVVPWQHEGQIRGLIYKVTDNTTFVGVQNQLFQAQKMSTIGAMAAGVAHDFNNLLLAIRGNVALVLMDSETSAHGRTRLEQVENAASRASDLTQQLLMFSRASEENVTVLDFNQVVQDAAQLARRMMRGKVDLKLHPTEAPLKVQMDATRAAQILLNLCINANDAMPEGGQLVITNTLADLTETQLAKTRIRPSAQFMRCTVSDTGSGIPPEELPRIFAPFYTTKPQGKGTGLGLSIVQSVVGKAGGFIEVESRIGQGTSFHIYLPIQMGPLTRTDTELRHQLKKGSGRLLVVDDLDLVLEFASNFLRQAGYQVFTATSAEAALKILVQQKSSIDLLFTDYSMPGKNGWQLIQEVAKRWPLTKCVLASGYLDDDERAEISKDSSVRILSKPYGIAQATRLISEVLQPKMD